MRAKKEKKPRTKSYLRETLELIAETAVFVFFILTFVVQAVGIPTPSMEPSLLVGDFLLVNKMITARTASGLERTILPRRAVRRGDMVAFKSPPENLEKDYVKRVIGLPGESVEVRDKTVLVDGRPLDEPYKVHILGVLPLPGDDFGPLTVPPGMLFVMGDNRDNSADSRVWGLLPLDYVKGFPWLVYFSYRADPDAHIRTSLPDRLRRFLTYLPRARWNRLFKVVR